MQRNGHFDFSSEIVISGISGRFPNSANVDEFWQNLINGRDMVSDGFDRFNAEEYNVVPRMGVIRDLDKFDSEFFMLHAKQALAVDPRLRCLLESTYEAIVDAGVNPSILKGSRTAVFVGAMESDSSAIWKRTGAATHNYYGAFGMNTCMLANRISFAFDFRGPSYVIDTSCASSSVAVQHALLSIRNGLCDAAIVAGAQIQQDPVSSSCFHQLKMTSPDGKCKVFDAAANGYVRSEAVAALYICRKEVAKRAYATIVHACVNNDGYKEQGVTFPSQMQQESAMRQTYKECGVEPHEVDYVEAHGTGTKVGDPLEMATIANVFCGQRKGPLLVGAVKSNMGHAETASGVCQLAKVVLSHNAGIIPANLHYSNPNPAIASLQDGRIQVVDKNMPFNAKYVAVNSMGYGGTNVHILLKMPPRINAPNDWNPPVPLMMHCSGRTLEAVDSFLEQALNNCGNQSFVRLTHEVYKDDTSRHPFRGFVIRDQENSEIQVDRRDSGRSVWFIFTGLGSQWPGMCRDLIKFEEFERSLKKSWAALTKHEIDLQSILKSDDPKTFEDFKNAMISITAVQIALVDLLDSIGVRPNGIVGHSAGEVAAAYADSCLTQDQTLLVALARVRGYLESDCPPGTVASVGLTWEEAKKRCPEGIFPAIHNAKNNVTVAGPPDVVHSFVKELEGEGILAKMVRSAVLGFHSPLVKNSAKLQKSLMVKIIPDPKPRSSKWLSSSVPEDQWHSELAKYCSPDYLVNNGIMPVYFYTTILHVPEHSVVMEIAPHCYMQSILKQTLPGNAIKVGLIHAKSPNNCLYFLDSIGKCYIAGVNVNLSALYEPVEFPVAPETPGLSSLIHWDHSDSFAVLKTEMELSNEKGIKFTCNLAEESDAYLEGHRINENILLPATGYLYYAWKCFAKLRGSTVDKCPVVFENVRFERLTLLSKGEEKHFIFNLLAGTGMFEISELDTLVCSGVIREVAESFSNETLSYATYQDNYASGPSMNRHDFYKEVRLRGYGYSELFQGVQEIDLRGKWAKVKWLGEWVSFMDAILQSCLLQNNSRDLCVPVGLQKITIDPAKVKKHLNANANMVTVRIWDHRKSVTCHGIEIRGLVFTKFNQKSRKLLPSAVEQVFVPYLENPMPHLSDTNALDVSLQIVVENSFGPKFVMTEILKNSSNMISHKVVNHCQFKFALSEFRLVNESRSAIDEAKMAISKSSIISLAEVQTREGSHLIVVDNESRISDAASAVIVGGFILYRGAFKIIPHPDTVLVSEQHFQNEEKHAFSYCLYRKYSPIPIPTEFKFISISVESYSWVDEAKQAINALSESERIYFVSHSPTSGLVGFVKCLAAETTPKQIRCFHAIDTLEMDFNRPCDSLRSQIQHDLVYNVYKNMAWGMLANLSIPPEAQRKKVLTSFAFADALTLGDLSSLHWIESPLKLAGEELVEVHYSALNFHDVMFATGKLVLHAVPETHATKQECILGLEFAGTYQGNRVCGMAVSECFATHIRPDNLVLLDVPNHWTYEEAATVPCVYGTAYVALILRGRIQPGESILIHAGSGGVGQAAIQIALSMNCRVFTTVSTTEKREFLKSRFPSLSDECFSNSRDAKEFESHIQDQTKGKGVDLVLNCLAQDKLHASIRCLAVNGRFLEIGKFDIYNDTKLGMSILLKGVSIIGVIVDIMLEQVSSKEVQEMRVYLQKGILSGEIRPLTYHVFKHSQVEEAFRFMATAKHIGKVLIEVKQDDGNSASIPAYPRTYFYPNKSYVIIGGLGGMGFELVNWMVERGARNLVLSSRSGNKSSYHQFHISKFEQWGIKIVIDRSDVSTPEGTRCLLQVSRKLGPIGGIFNTAVVLRDAMFENQTPADFEEVARCKVEATKNLDLCSRELAPELDHFVVFSSIVAARGNAGQTNYGYANAVMERICELRKVVGFPALSVQWGAVDDVGVFHRTLKDRLILGLAPQKIKSCLETLDCYLQQDRTVVSSFVTSHRTEAAQMETTTSIVQVAANILGIKNVKKIDPKAPLVDLGMDSLMSAQLTQALQSYANLQLSRNQHTNLTFEKLAELDAKLIASSKQECENESGYILAQKPLMLKPLPTETVVNMRSLRKFDEQIFVVHPLDGTVATLEELASELNCKVYGIECTQEAPLESVETLGEFYLQKIQKIQPTGPYKLAGYSFGASVAFEMALKLEKRNEVVSLLLLLDGSPQWYHYLGSKDGDALVQEWENRATIGYVMQYTPRISLKTCKEISAMKTLEEKVSYSTRLLQESYPDFRIEDMKILASTFLDRSKSFRAYVAQGKVKARTILIKARMTEVGLHVAYDYGLSDVCEGKVEVIEVDGNHYCFHEKPTELGIPALINEIIR